MAFLFPSPTLSSKRTATSPIRKTMANSSSHNDALDISKIAGNGSDELKQLFGDVGEFFHNRRAAGMNTSGFGEAIQRRLRVTEISINKKAEEERKTEARVVIETEVREDMLNGGGNIHGGCSAFLVDVCSSIALFTMVMATQGTMSASVTQSLNVVYHSPAQLGDTLRIVNTTLTVGARAHSVRTEIWNVTHRRLVVSGTHVKMVPSPPKPKSNL